MNYSLEALPPQGFRQMCWRGLRLWHPAEWEPAALSGPKEPAKCILVDRRLQRLQADWQTLRRPPDLKAMFEAMRHRNSEEPAVDLAGVPGWTGLVREESDSTVVVAGRYFADAACLVQAVLSWPGKRDRGLEKTVLGSVAPLPPGPVQPWQALGIVAEVPEGFDLQSASGRVGHVAWKFRRPGKGSAGLSLERIAMPGHWLKGTVGEWLARQIPAGFKQLRQLRVPCAGHQGEEVHSRRGGAVTGLTGRGVYRLDRAWLCPTDERVYRMAYWQNSAGEVELPSGFRSHCCREARSQEARP